MRGRTAFGVHSGSLHWDRTVTDHRTPAPGAADGSPYFRARLGELQLRWPQQHVLVVVPTRLLRDQLSSEFSGLTTLRRLEAVGDDSPSPASAHEITPFAMVAHDGQITYPGRPS